MLIENTLLGVVDKVDIAIRRLKSFELEDGYYVAFGGANRQGGSNSSNGSPLL